MVMKPPDRILYALWFLAAFAVMFWKLYELLFV